MKLIAPKGKRSDLVKIEETDTVDYPAGSDGEGCLYLEELSFVTTTSTWNVDGADRKVALRLVELDGRYYMFDLPGK
jgi:hypothetical protein